MRSLLVALCVSIMIPACAVPPDDQSATSEDAVSTRYVEIGDDKRTFEVEQGQDLVITLPGDDVAAWTIVSTTKAMGVPAPREGRFLPPRFLLGRGTQVFEWKDLRVAPSSRSHKIVFESRRPGQTSAAPPLSRFEVKVKMKAPGAREAPEDELHRPLVLEAEGADMSHEVFEGRDVVVRLPQRASWRMTSGESTLGRPRIVQDGGASVLSWETAYHVGSHTIVLTAGTQRFAFDLVVAPSYCPPLGTVVDCSAPVEDAHVPFCAPGYRAWARTSCDARFID